MRFICHFINLISSSRNLRLDGQRNSLHRRLYSYANETPYRSFLLLVKDLSIFVFFLERMFLCFVVLSFWSKHIAITLLYAIRSCQWEQIKMWKIRSTVSTNAKYIHIFRFIICVGMQMNLILRIVRLYVINIYNTQ